jgi:hypothetical protein
MRRRAQSHTLSMSYRFFTIGHSTRSIGEFVGLLRAMRRFNSSLMFGLSRDHAPTHNTTRMCSPKRCLNPRSHTSTLRRSGACVDGGGTYRRT